MERYLSHHGIKGQEWGDRNGPPYPLDRETHNEVVRGKDDDDKQNNVRPDDSYNKELDRIDIERNYEDMMAEEEAIERSRKRTRNIIIAAGAAVAIVGGVLVVKKVRKNREERNALAEALESMKDRLDKDDKDIADLVKNKITKDDLKDFAKSSDLKGFAKSSDLKGFAKASDLKNFVTKNSLNKSSEKSTASKIGSIFTKKTKLTKSQKKDYLDLLKDAERNSSVGLGESLNRGEEYLKNADRMKGIFESINKARKSVR